MVWKKENKENKNREKECVEHDAKREPNIKYREQNCGVLLKTGQKWKWFSFTVYIYINIYLYMRRVYRFLYVNAFYAYIGYDFELSSFVYFLLWP